LRDARCAAHLQNCHLVFLDAGFSQRGTKKSVTARAILSDADNLAFELLEAGQGRIGSKHDALRRKIGERR
jgi:hypothetical protein